MSEPIEMPFGVWSRVDPRNHVLDRGADPPYEGAILKGLYLHGKWLAERARTTIFFSTTEYERWRNVGPSASQLQETVFKRDKI